MRRLITCLACFTLLAGGLAIARDASTSSSATVRPAWCQPGYECITRQELSQATIRLIDLQEENARLKARSKRVGVHLTCGMGVGAVVTNNFDVKAAPVGFCGVGYGF